MIVWVSCQAMQCLLRVLEQKCPTQAPRQIRALLRYSDTVASLSPNLLEMLRMKL